MSLPELGVSEVRHETNLLLDYVLDDIWDDHTPDDENLSNNNKDYEI